jgi:hypothetical protein
MKFQTLAGIEPTPSCLASWPLHHRGITSPPFSLSLIFFLIPSPSYSSFSSFPSSIAFLFWAQNILMGPEGQICPYFLQYSFFFFDSMNIFAWTFYLHFPLLFFPFQFSSPQFSIFPPIPVFSPTYSYLNSLFPSLNFLFFPLFLSFLPPTRI